jgi:uncharacterized protein YukJ
MPLDRYAVLKGRVIARRHGAGERPHYHVHVVSAGKHYRIAINIHSHVAPADLQYVVDTDWEHPLRPRLVRLPDGLTVLDRPGGVALDYVRGSLFRRSRMRTLPYYVPGHDNDLNEKLDHAIVRAIEDRAWTLYAWGEPWGPDPGRDALFGFSPLRGMHDVHMNQGSIARFADKDATWQDGGVVLHHEREDRWIGIFLKFQSQTWYTDDEDGRAHDPAHGG